MAAIIAAIMLLGSQLHTVPARANRVTFYEAEQKIKEGWTMKQVREVLGPPDAIERSAPGIPNRGHQEIWLTHVLFQPKDPSGFFRVPGIGGITPSPPKDLRTWPDFPMVIVKDVPYNVYWGAELFGFPEPFSSYVRSCADDWAMRTDPLRPPDDPFGSLPKAIRIARDRLKGSEYPGDDPAAFLQWQILQLIGAANGPFPNENLSNKVEAAHKVFSAAGGHWDVNQQAYVNREGKSLGR